VPAKQPRSKPKLKAATASLYKGLDPLKLFEQQYGPGTCLLAGSGYLYSRAVERLGDVEDLPLPERAAMFAEMAEDWRIHRSAILQAWDTRHERQPPHEYILRDLRKFNGGDRPWAARFDEPMKENDR
jgi:hypothetical protein